MERLRRRRRHRIAPHVIVERDTTTRAEQSSIQVVPRISALEFLHLCSSACPTKSSARPAQDGSYPSPQLVRPRWLDLSGEWDFAFDDDVRGRRPPASPRVPPHDRRPVPARVAPLGHRRHRLPQRRLVPPPRRRSRARGRRTCRGRTLLAALRRRGLPRRGVDRRAPCRHRTKAATRPSRSRCPGLDGGFEIVVRAEDDPHDLSQPRGKQDWQLEPHSIWYRRTTGIWQPVWLESVPRQHLTRRRLASRHRERSVHLTLELAARPAEPARAHVTLHHGEQQLAEVTVTIAGRAGADRDRRSRRSGPSRGSTSCCGRPSAPCSSTRASSSSRVSSTRRRVGRTSACAGSRPSGASSSLNSRPLPDPGRPVAGLLAAVPPRRALAGGPARRGGAHQGPRLQHGSPASEGRRPAADVLGRPARSSRVDRDAERVRAFGCRGDPADAGMDGRHPP